MPTSQPKPAKKGRGHSWAKPAKKSRISRAKQTEVVALAVAGHSQRKIAKEANINRETVARILSQNEYDTLASELRSKVITEIGHDAVKSLHALVKRQNVQAVLQTLFGLRILSTTQQLEMKGGLEGDERDYADAKFQFYYKHGRWPTLEEAKEFDKTIEVVPLTKKQTN